MNPYGPGGLPVPQFVQQGFSIPLLWALGALALLLGAAFLVSAVLLGRRR